MNELSSPLLTIMIPVFNGERFLRNLLQQFADQYMAHPDQYERQVEIRVVNNASTDDTRIVAESFQANLPFLVVQNESTHVATAEENVFRAFPACRGEYTWVLGVDDFPVFQNLPRVLEALEKRSFDFVLFNSSIIDQNLKFSSYSVTNFSTEMIEKDITELACDLGLWFVLAGLSSQIVRTQVIRSFDLKELVETTSPIYAHVIAYLEAYKGRPCAMFNYPLVTYRVTYCDDQHWQKAATTLGVFDMFFWTLGPIRQFKHLERNQTIPHDFFFYLLDRNEYSVFRPVHVILNRVIRQLEIMIKDRSSRNQMTRAQLIEIQDYICARDPFSRQLMWKISVDYEQIISSKVIARAKRKLVGDLRLLLSQYVANGTYAAFFVEQIHGFNIYRMRSGFYAVLEGCNTLFETKMRDIAGFQDYFPVLFSAKDRKELLQKISPAHEILRVRDGREFANSAAALAEVRHLVGNTNWPMPVTSFNANRKPETFMTRTLTWIRQAATKLAKQALDNSLHALLRIWPET